MSSCTIVLRYQMYPNPYNTLLYISTNCAHDDSPPPYIRNSCTCEFSLSQNMDFSLFFTIVARLTFTIEYNVNSNATQGYFFFKGERSSAHLYRENQTLNLYVQSNSSYELYEFSNVSRKFGFAWKGYKVDGSNMIMIRSNGKVEGLEFSGYTFLSPHIDINQGQNLVDSKLEPIFSNSPINYGFILLIVLCIGVLLKTDVPAIKLWEILRNSSNIPETLNDEDPYVTMV